MSKCWMVLVVLLLYGQVLEAANIGRGFGESVLVLTSARQQGTGGIALEDPWRKESVFEANSVFMTSGLRWYGFGYQGGLGSALRIGGEAFVFSPPESIRTFENSDGSFGGTGGTVNAPEWGGRLLGQLSVFDAWGWKIAAVGRVSGLLQQLPGENNFGMGLEAGGQAQYELGDGRLLTSWALAGPFGRGASRGFAGLVSGGVGLKVSLLQGLLGAAGGYSIGVEGQWLTESLVHGGLGGMYWFGDVAEPGAIFFLRAGLRHADMSAQEFQPRAGLGILWRQPNGLGIQFDYAIAPTGEAGAFHYATVGIKLGSSVQRRGYKPTSVVEEPIPPPRPEEETIYFCPECGELASIEIEVQSESTFAAVLLDGEAVVTLFTLVELKVVEPGSYVVEWDGMLKYGDQKLLAAYDVPYIIRVSANNETRHVKVVVKRQQ